MYTNFYNRQLGDKININSKLGRDVIYNNLSKIVKLYGGGPSDNTEKNNVFTDIINEASANAKIDLESSNIFIKNSELGSPTPN